MQKTLIVDSGLNTSQLKALAAVSILSILCLVVVRYIELLLPKGKRRNGKRKGA